MDDLKGIKDQIKKLQESLEEMQRRDAQLWAWFQRLKEKGEELDEPDTLPQELENELLNGLH